MLTIAWDICKQEIIKLSSFIAWTISELFRNEWCLTLRSLALANVFMEIKPNLTLLLTKQANRHSKMSTLNSLRVFKNNSVFNQLVSAIKKVLLRVLTRVTKMLYLQLVETEVDRIPYSQVTADSKVFSSKLKSVKNKKRISTLFLKENRIKNLRMMVLILMQSFTTWSNTSSKENSAIKYILLALCFPDSMQLSANLSSFSLWMWNLSAWEDKNTLVMKELDCSAE